MHIPAPFAGNVLFRNMKRTFKLFICALLLCLALPFEGTAQDDVKAYAVTEVPNVYATDRRMHVSDPGGILQHESRSVIDRIFTQLEDSTGIQTMVVLLPSIGQEDVFEYSHNLFSHWGLGEKERNNGLLVLFVADQRKIRFHTGYGIEGHLPDAICKRIQNQYMIPAFKAGNIDEGMVMGAKAIYATLESSMKAGGTQQGELGMPVILFMVMMLAGFGLFMWVIVSSQRSAMTCRKCGTRGALRVSSRDYYRAADGLRHKKEILVCSHCNAVEVRDSIDEDHRGGSGGLMEGMIIGSMLGGGRRSYGGGGFGGGFGGSFGGGSSGGGGATSGW